MARNIGFAFDAGLPAQPARLNIDIRRALLAAARVGFAGLFVLMVSCAATILGIIGLSYLMA